VVKINRPINFAVFCYIAPRFDVLRSIDCTAMSYFALVYAALHCIALSYVAIALLRYVALRCAVLC
jgi:hypothetical protein